MKLIIGGCAQGKLQYVLQEQDQQPYHIEDAVLPRQTKLQEGSLIMDHLHQWVKAGLEQGRDPKQELEEFLSEHQGRLGDLVLISDEIGNGIVPIDDFEREYREYMGRLLVWLAKQADEVVRVICGIGQKIK